jgi:hypothetical protein
MYDMVGRKTAVTDPDAGQSSDAYDQVGNLTQSIDGRGLAGTVFVGYDGIDRPIWRNSTNSATGAFATFTSDSTASGNEGVGRLTGRRSAVGRATA